MEFTDKDKRDAGRLARKGAEVLKDRNWIKNNFGDKDNIDAGMCAIGAMNFALCGNPKPKTFPRIVQLTNDLFGKWSGDAVGIPSFNDLHATSKEEVVQMLEKFADEFDPQRG